MEQITYVLFRLYNLYSNVNLTLIYDKQVFDKNQPKIKEADFRNVTLKRIC